MKKIAILVEGYMNQTEANAICIKGIINEMKKNISVDVISIEKDFFGWNDNVYSINKSNTEFKNELRRKFVKFLHMPVGNKKLTRLIAKETNIVLKAKRYDALIVVINPVEAADAIHAIRKKNQNLNIILYEIDPASNRYKKPKNIIEKIWMNKSISWEKKVYKYCKIIIHMRTHKAHFSRSCFNVYRTKTLYLGIPSFRVDILQNSENDACVMVYAGAFYPVLRNPFPMIEILKELSKYLRIKVYIYTGNGMIDDIRKSVSDYEMIHVNEYVTQDILREAYLKADVLLDLGNKESDYLPSKTLQYMGTGKPIIHFQPDDNDVSVEYLKRYKKALIIPTNQDSNNIDMIVDFLRKENRKKDTYTAEELTNLFYENTPSFTAKKLLEIIK